MLLLQDLDGVKNDGLPFKKEEPCLLSTPYCQCCPAKAWVMAKPVDVELAAGFLEGQGYAGTCPYSGCDLFV